MNLTSKLSSLNKELEEQTKIEDRAHNRIIELRRLIKSAERLIKDANDIFSEEKVVEPESTGVYEDNKQFLSDTPMMGKSY
jgi:hypothetical protein